MEKSPPEDSNTGQSLRWADDTFAPLITDSPLPLQTRLPHAEVSPSIYAFVQTSQLLNMLKMSGCLVIGGL